MSTKKPAPGEKISMTEFWKTFAGRLAEHVPGKKINEFEVEKELVGFRLDRVVQGKKGVDVKTLIRICATLDLSPAWLVFGKGPRKLSALAVDDRVAEAFEEVLDDDARTKKSPSKETARTQRRGTRASS